MCTESNIQCRSIDLDKYEQWHGFKTGICLCRTFAIFFLSMMTSLAHLTTLDLVLPQPPFRSALPICDLKKMYVCNISTSMNAKYLIASSIFDLLKNFLLIGCLLENRGQFSTETFMQITKKKHEKLMKPHLSLEFVDFSYFERGKRRILNAKKIEWKKHGFPVSDPYQFDWKGVENSVNRKGINRNIPSQHCIA